MKEYHTALLLVQHIRRKGRKRVSSSISVFSTTYEEERMNAVKLSREPSLYLAFQYIPPSPASLCSIDWV